MRGGWDRWDAVGWIAAAAGGYGHGEEGGEEEVCRVGLCGGDDDVFSGIYTDLKMYILFYGYFMNVSPRQGET